MPRTASKGEATREAILDAAIDLAREVGLSALTIGALAERAGMSKSGLFAHFGAKEELQLAVLRAAQSRFDDEVSRIAFQAPRGLPRLRELFERWLGWAAAQRQPGGCLMIAAASEFDDRPGPVRDFLASQQQGWLLGLGRTVQFAVETGELPADTDTEQFAFELFGLILSTHHHVRLLSDSRFVARARQGLERLISAPPRQPS
ncbi:TetR/AcrR family transcriptional regulator [Chitinimonas koreensis]|uniref:TetR/AcrR family transcriptional regulator n=1 Tax=Chitinimonas koreensis TaxID=356302 RepID=UPI000401EB51|nr:TetR/AcrR family transcriptional regulator [Chitinimonas koreensis]QNM98473.1 TetR/AcrR family transcriptional regulator [Chitinimonas koreensis]